MRNEERDTTTVGANSEVASSQLHEQLQMLDVIANTDYDCNGYIHHASVFTERALS